VRIRTSHWKIDTLCTLRASAPMTSDDDLRIRLGRIRDRGSARRAKPFIAQVLAATEKAGGRHRRSQWNTHGAAFGRGRAAGVAAIRRLSDRTRSVTVKARVVRHRQNRVPLKDHLVYLRREGVTKEGAAGRMDARTMYACPTSTQ
jgi:hypothetical protein